MNTEANGVITPAQLQMLGIVLAVIIGIIAVGRWIWQSAKPRRGKPRGSKIAFQGILNPVSGLWLIIVISFTVYGIVFLLLGKFWQGAPSFIFGFVALLKGFKFPKDEAPAKVWLITAFGRMTVYRSYGITFLFDWLFGVRIISYVEFELKQVDIDIKMKKPIFCVDEEYVDGFLSIGASPDHEDDKEEDIKDPDRELLSGGHKLRNLANIGGIGGVEAIVDDMATNWVQDRGNKTSGEEMERKCADIGLDLKDDLVGKLNKTSGRPNSPLDDTRDLGFAFKKFNLILAAVPEIQKERNNVTAQKVQRKANLVDEEMISDWIERRATIIADGIKHPKSGEYIVRPVPEKDRPTYVQLRAQAIEELLLNAGKVQQIKNRGGISVANVTP